MMSTLGFGQTETFQTGIPADWAIEGATGVMPNLTPATFANNWIHTPTGGVSSSGGATVNPASNNTVGNPAEYFLITKLLTTPTNAELRFLTKQGSFTNRGGTYQVRISLANQPDLDSFNVTLASWTETQLNVSATTYEEKIVDIPLPQGTQFYLAFVAMSTQTGTTATSGDSWFIDNVRVITECPPAANITIIPGATSATVNWTHPSTNTFGIEIVPFGAGHGALGTPVTGTTYTTTAPLTPATQYDVYVRAYCDSDTGSAWVGPFTFTTSQVGLNCGNPIVIPPNVTTPYVLSSNLANYFSLTDYTPYTTIGSNCFPASAGNQLSGNHVFFNYTPTTTGLIDITQTVNVASGGGGNNCWNASSSIMVFNSCADVGVTCLAAAMTGSNNSTAQIPNFYVTAGHTYVIVMSSPYGHSENQNAGLCFTFTVSGSACAPPSPSGTTHNNLTQTSANFSWTNVGNLASSWNYVVLPATSGAPNGSTSFLTTTTNLNNPAGLVLTAATDYNLYVQSVCTGVGAGPWSAAYPFRTPCNVLPLNYYTGFNDGSMVDTCWSQLNLNTDLKAFTFGPNAFSEPVAKFPLNPSDNNDMLISPQFHLDAATPKRLRFKFNNYGNWGLIVNNPTGGPCNFEVKMSTTGIGASNFTLPVVPLVPRTTAYNFMEITMPLPVVTGDINLAWIVPPGAAQAGNWLYIDDVYIEDMPACSEPAYPVVTPGSITTNSVNISWTPGFNNTQWQIIAQPLGTGVPTFPLTPGAVMEIVSDNPHTMLGLNPSTQYEFYMRAYCSASEQSIWVGPINFNTLCIPQPTPYYESLNDADLPVTKKFCWSTNNANNDPAKWIIGTTEATILPQPITFFDPFVSYDDWLITVGVNAVGTKILRYKYRVIASPGPIPLFPRGNFEVLMSSTPDFSTYTTIIPAYDFTNEDYMENSVIFTGTGVSYFAFRLPPNMVNPTQTGRVSIDDFVIEDAPACPNPTGLLVNNITTSTAQVTWTPGYNETSWQVSVLPIGSGIPTTGATVNGTPIYNAGPLAQNTEYEIYVRAACGANGNSTWLGPITFRTTCNPLPTPFIETFNSNSATESCWRSIDANGDDNEWNLNSTVNPMFGDQMAALFTGTNGDNNDWLISPTLTAHANQRLRFYYKTYSTFFEEDLKVKLSINGADITQFTTLLYENNLATTTDATGVVNGSNTINVASTQGILVGDVMYIPVYPFPYLTTVTAISGNTITLSQNATMDQPGVQHVEFKHETINNTETREMVINLPQITSDTNINIGFYTPFYPANPWNYRGQLTFIDNVIIEDIPACPSPINVTHSNLIDTTVDINWQEVGTATSWQVSVQPFGTPAPVGNTLPAYLTTATGTPHATISGLTPSAQYQYYVRAICSGSSQSVWVGPFEFVTLCDFASVCQYTITTISGNTGQPQTINVMQNGVVIQPLSFPGFGQPASLDATVFLCSGIAFNLYWQGSGSGVQYSQAQIIIKDENNNVVWTSPLGLGTVNTNIYSGISSCGVITCPQPTSLTVNNMGVLSWTPGGTETQWEVAIQPLGNGSLPQAWHPVSGTPNYTPVPADFVDGMAGTYEYFVRAVCGGTSGASYWSGPKIFIRNDEAATAIHLTPNTGTFCDVSGVDASFIGATQSATPTTCGGLNAGDIWYDFVATSRVHTIELSHFGPGSYYTSAYQGVWPKVIISLYEVQLDGSLVEKGCSEDHSFVTEYSSECVVGKTYKIRLKLNTAQANDKKFHICITTPDDLCDRDSFNADFEKLPMQNVTGVSTIIDGTVVPGWRVSTDWGAIFFHEASNSLDMVPYSGGQCIQLVQDPQASWNPNDPNIKGIYKDLDTSEIPQMDYSFASASRVTSAAGTTLALYAGPPSGPFTLVTQDQANSNSWQLIQGTYNVPSGQNRTRFIFRVVGNAVGHMLDAANFKAKVDIDTAPTTLDCETTSLHLDAHGVGHWEADVANPGASTIVSPNSISTDITGLTTPGSYIFHWITRYCDKTITIVKQGTSAVAIVTPTVNYCLNQTAAPLTATPPSGNTLMWYTLPNGGQGTVTAPTPATTTVGSTSYYVSAVDQNGCQGPRTEIVVTVNALPTATISGGTTICSGGTATVTFTGTPNATVTYTVNSGSNQTIVLNASGTASITTPALTGLNTYALVSAASAGAGSCSQTQSGTAVINVTALPTATIAGTTAICNGGTAMVTFTGTPNATVTYTVNSGGNQTITLNGTGTATITTPALTSDANYTLVSVTSTGALICNQTQTGSAIITVTPLPTASISGSTTICQGGTATITFTGTPNATVTYTVDSGSNQTITLNGTGTATITTPSLTTNSTYALVNVTAMGALSCNQIVVGTAVVNVVTLPTATISGATTICSGGTATVTFTGTPNAVVTYTVNSGSNQTITLNGSGSATITSPVLTGDSIYTLVSATLNGATPCSQTQTGAVVVTVTPLPTAAISGTTSVCPNGTATITFTGTPNATVTYTVNSGSNQTITLNGTGTATITTPALTGTATYALVSVAATTCSQTQSGSAVVTVSPLPTASISSISPICSGSTSTVTITGTPNSTVTYTVDSGANQTIVLDGTGTATITTPILFSNSTYTLVNVAAAACSQPLSTSTTIVVVTAPTATIAGATSICNGGTAVITFTGTPNATVTYTVNSGANQTITLDGTGNATVTTPILTADSTYALVSVATATCNQTLTGSVTITVNPLLTASISGTTPICTGATAIVSFTGTPNAVVTYSVNSGANQTITLNATGTASITTPALTAITTYTLVSVTTGTCTQNVTGNVVINVNPLTAQNLVFSYNATCLNATTSPLPVLTAGFAAGGVFSSTTLIVNPTTGAVTLGAVGTHTITYTLAPNVANCTLGGTSSATIVINNGTSAITAFDYDNTYCSSTTNATPTLAAGFTSGGTFTSATGLSINGTTGAINVASSTPGTYTVTYTVTANPATCNTGGSSTDVVIIAAPISVIIEENCENQMLVLHALPVNGSFDPNTVNYAWSDGTNANVGGNSDELNLDNYFALYPSATFPITFTVTVNASGCTGTALYTVTENPCKIVPKGISPNGDGDNDTFDLTGMGVKEINIFNRYGTKVYSYSGTYTNQWKGASENGNDLPDGTYFYSINKNNNTTVTGWVYINR